MERLAPASHAPHRLELIAYNLRGRYGPLQAAARLQRHANDLRSASLFGSTVRHAAHTPHWGELAAHTGPPISGEELDRARVEEERAEAMGARIVTWLDDEYPFNLRVAHAPPPVLYVKGALPPGEKQAVAVVGSRKATREYLQFSSDLSYRLARAGFTIVSGLAIGVDRSAHEGALEAGGRTIAVLGHGVHMTYPPHHAKLAQEIVARGGAVVSFFPLGVAPRPYHFPARNWTIAGLSLGVVVVQGRKRSGAMITANAAAAMGREVLAVPGSVVHPLSEGPHALLRDGAHLVSDYRHVLEALGVEEPAAAAAADRDLPRQTALFEDSPVRRAVVESLAQGPATLSELVDRSGADVSRVLAALTQLEIEGYLTVDSAGAYGLRGR